ncbi:hypothetical protein J3R30DRAFT_3732781 [Lentinula aciculospora]|uniref:Uncharacterized protein n=1 Tax=Lentinula aciculospora TaxID=153920 RepID=A0A9W9AFL0_9AGAR|nr:hypothetical protein J3R30DRAFT_3732781 [Lentinula aciculospora]
MTITMNSRRVQPILNNHPHVHDHDALNGLNDNYVEIVPVSLELHPDLWREGLVESGSRNTDHTPSPGSTTFNPGFTTSDTSAAADLILERRMINEKLSPIVVLSASFFSGPADAPPSKGPHDIPDSVVDSGSHAIPRTKLVKGPPRFKGQSPSIHAASPDPVEGPGPKVDSGTQGRTQTSGGNRRKNPHILLTPAEKMKLHAYKVEIYQAEPYRPLDCYYF